MRSLCEGRISIRMVVRAPARTYLVECYTPGIEQHVIQAAAERARAAVLALQAEGRNLDYVNAILVPDDDVVFHVFASDDPEVVREASVNAELPFERIVESVSVGEASLPNPAPSDGQAYEVPKLCIRSDLTTPTVSSRLTPKDPPS